MSIKYVVLGYLNWQPMAGYEIKRKVADAETLPWSANDNQVYQALVELHQDGWVSKETPTENSPSNHHIYTITEAGVTALKAWITSLPEPPQTQSSFLNQLMWSDSLDVAEMEELLEAYLNAVGEKLFFMRVQADEKPNRPNRTLRETYLWDMISRNWIAHYELELKWIRQIQQELSELEIREQRALRRSKNGLKVQL